MGLSGSGKSTLAKQIYTVLPSTWLNADRIRRSYDDWDFSYAGRLHQAVRMKTMADVCDDAYVIIDMIAPLEEMRTILEPDFIIWMNTKQSSQYKDTDAIFEPVAADLILTNFEYDINDIVSKIR